MFKITNVFLFKGIRAFATETLSSFISSTDFSLELVRSLRSSSVTWHCQLTIKGGMDITLYPPQVNTC